jgi:hypothetical protein
VTTRARDPHDWKVITKWKTWAHDWCANCGTVRVMMEGTTIPFYNTPKNSVPCGEKPKP